MTLVRLAPQTRNSDCVLKSQQNPTQSRSACRSIVGLCIFLLGLFGSASSSAASDPAQVTNGWSTPPVPAAAPAALIDLSKSPIGADDRGTYWATFDPVPSTQAPAPGALPTSPTVITEPDKTDKANGNG